VLIESKDATSTWNTIGVSTNIIEASWHALLDSMDYAIIRKLSEDCQEKQKVAAGENK
jgi:2-isopropylmalate synthase